MSIFSSMETKTESTFSFQYNIIIFETIAGDVTSNNILWVVFLYTSNERTYVSIRLAVNHPMTRM